MGTSEKKQINIRHSSNIITDEIHILKMEDTVGTIKD